MKPSLLPESPEHTHELELENGFRCKCGWSPNDSSLPSPEQPQALKPCPFCGSAAEIHVWPALKTSVGTIEQMFSIECISEPPKNCPQGRHYLLGSRIAAVNAWNERALPSVSDGGSSGASVVSVPESEGLTAQVKQERLLLALSEARATFMNLGIDNASSMGLQLRKAAGRITKTLDELDALVGVSQDRLEEAVRKVIRVLENDCDLGPTVGDGVVTWPLGAEIRHRLREALSLPEEGK